MFHNHKTSNNCPWCELLTKTFINSQEYILRWWKILLEYLTIQFSDRCLKAMEEKWLIWMGGEGDDFYFSKFLSPNLSLMNGESISQPNPWRWGVVGNRREALLWDLEAGKIDEQVKPVPVKVGTKEISERPKLVSFRNWSKSRWEPNQFVKGQNMSATEIDLTKFDLKVWMVCLMHPFVFLVGGDDWEGLQVREALKRYWYKF